MNTVFKLYYQAWLLMGVGATCALVRLWRGGGRWQLLSVLSVLIIGVCFYYPGAAAYSKAGGYQGVPTLDGTAYLQEESPAEYAIYRWLLDHGKPGDVVVEGEGEAYNASTARLSAFTGMPTILGWQSHEVQWRGDASEVQSRLADLEAIYRGRDQARVLELLKKYDATYLYISPYEIETYRLTERTVTWYGTFLEPAFAVNDRWLFRVPLR